MTQGGLGRLNFPVLRSSLSSLLGVGRAEAGGVCETFPTSLHPPPKPQNPQPSTLSPSTLSACRKVPPLPDDGIVAWVVKERRFDLLLTSSVRQRNETKLSNARSWELSIKPERTLTGTHIMAHNSAHPRHNPPYKILSPTPPPPPRPPTQKSRLKARHLEGFRVGPTANTYKNLKPE